MGANEALEALEATNVSGRRIGRYLLRYEIASGGMGEVYLAQMRGPAGVDRWVALKVLRPHIAEQKKFVTMFLDEARIAARLSHPNLCAVVDFGQSDGRYFLALEYLHGETLSKVVRRVHTEAKATPGSPIAVDLLTRIVVDAARGLHAAHEARGADGQPLHVVHRDVSPQNVFVLYDGIAKVMDFGIASAAGRESHTTTGEVKGKFAYMSPEQLSGQKVDRRTDVFALGVVFWETLAGRRLFRAESEGETVLNVMSREIVPPSEHNRNVPDPVDRIVMRALDRDPERRYQSAGDLADDIDDYLAVVGRPTGPAQVSAMMKRLFADRIITRDAMLRAPQAPLDIVPEIDAESGSSIRTVSPRPEVSVTTTPPPARPRIPWAIGGGVAAALLVGIGSGRGSGRRSGSGCCRGSGDPRAPGRDRAREDQEGRPCGLRHPEPHGHPRQRERVPARYAHRNDAALREAPARGPSHAAARARQRRPREAHHGRDPPRPAHASQRTPRPLTAASARPTPSSTRLRCPRPPPRGRGA